MSDLLTWQECAAALRVSVSWLAKGNGSGAAGADGGRTRRVDEAGEVVETSDHDTQVFSDGDGAGSQGRSTHDETAEATTDEPTTLESDGISHDDDGQLHLDLEA